MSYVARVCVNTCRFQAQALQGAEARYQQLLKSTAMQAGAQVTGPVGVPGTVYCTHTDTDTGTDSDGSADTSTDTDTNAKCCNFYKVLCNCMFLDLGFETLGDFYKVLCNYMILKSRI